MNSFFFHTKIKRKIKSIQSINNLFRKKTIGRGKEGKELEGKEVEEWEEIA